MWKKSILTSYLRLIDFWVFSVFFFCLQQSNRWGKHLMFWGYLVRKNWGLLSPNSFSNWRKLLQKAFIWVECWRNLFNIPNERIVRLLMYLSSFSEEIASVCGASLSREWDWGTGWGQPQPWGIRQLHGTGQGWHRMLTFGWGLGSSLVRWAGVRYCFRMTGHGHVGGVGHQHLLPIFFVGF